jgi:hypothetical protein
MIEKYFSKNLENIGAISADIIKNVSWQLKNI